MAKLVRHGRGAFIEGEAEGAIPNGRRVRKARSEPGDGTPIGTKGTILSSVRDDSVSPWPFYFIEWDSRTGAPVGTIGWKVEEAE